MPCGGVGIIRKKKIIEQRRAAAMSDLHAPSVAFQETLVRFAEAGDALPERQPWLRVLS